MDNTNIIVSAIAISGWIYSFYCQFQARKHISKDKVDQLKDLSKLANGPMPCKEILSEEGLKYYRGFCIGGGIFIGCILLMTLISIFHK